MKTMLVALLLTFVTQFAFAHGDESRVALEPEIQKAAAGKVLYQFQLVDTKNNKLLTDQDLNVSHEKKLHFMAYDPSLKEFQHVHPAFDGKLWTVELDFSVDGKYWVWAQGELAADKEDFTSSNRLDISGGSPAWPTPPDLSDIRSGVSGVSKVEISAEKILAGKMTMLMVKITRTDGTDAKIEPYLGAFAHVVAVPDDGDALMHVHPMDGSKPNEGMLHATFPVAGEYRLWIQFEDDGSLKTIPLSVKVF
jgi:hypothetical protein